MKNRLFLILAVLLMTFVLASCENEQKEMNAGDSSKLNVEATEKNEIEVTSAEVEATEAAETEAAETEQAGDAEVATAELPEKYIEKQLPKFAINGKVYTIGETSLQELIDDGVEFANPDHLDRDIDPRGEATAVVIVTGDYEKVELSAYNYDETAKSVTECVLSRLVAEGHIEGAEEVLKFSFPADLTLEMLTEKEGDNFDYGYYELEGVKIDTYGYFEDSFYDFAFKEGKYYGVTIKYKRS